MFDFCFFGSDRNIVLLGQQEETTGGNNVIFVLMFVGVVSCFLESEKFVILLSLSNV